MGESDQVAVPLFNGVGSGLHTANFTNTVFDDNAGTPIENGSAPFFATFNPQISLANFAGLDAAGVWTLVINNATTGSGGVGTFNGWSLTFQKPLPTSGLGEPGTDDASISFRIFTLSQTAALSSQEWTSVGPASIGGGGGSSGNENSAGARSGRVTGLAIDPSDPSGNTVYVAGASGGIWKSTNFLTTNPAGPTYIPLTNFGPTFAVNIGGIAVFPRNNNPADSIIIASTGEGDTGTTGVGFLISKDGGATWNLYDSTNNVDSNGNLLPIESATRDREFVGTTSYAVVVDPQLTPTGQVIIYAALSGPNGGIWRSEDTGNTWQLMLAGQATSVVLDPNSGTVLSPDTDTMVQGNLQVVFAGIRGVGVEMSPNQGQVWNMMTGGVGNPHIVNVGTGRTSIPPRARPPTVLKGESSWRCLARQAMPPKMPSMPAGSTRPFLHRLAAVRNLRHQGLRPELDPGPHLHLAADYRRRRSFNQALPTNDVTQPVYPVIGSTLFPQGNYNITMAVDPTNPSIIYVGGTADGSESALIRIDISTMWDAHNLDPYSDQATDGGTVDLNSRGPAPVVSNLMGVGPGPYLNFIRSPQDPFNGGSLCRSLTITTSLTTAQARVDTL